MLFNPITIFSSNILQFVNSLNRIKINTWQKAGAGALGVRATCASEFGQGGHVGGGWVSTHVLGV